jgi:hypothetical protein
MILSQTAFCGSASGGSAACGGAPIGLVQATVSPREGTVNVIDADEGNIAGPSLLLRLFV